MRYATLIVGMALAGLLAGCAALEPVPAPDLAPATQTVDATGALPIMERNGAGGLPNGWEPWILHPSKRKTRYETRGRNGDTVVWAHAEIGRAHV